MDLDTYLNSHKSAAEFAREIKAKESDVSNWRSGKRPVPVKRCVKIEMVTAGLVDRKSLRPTDWHEYWPELAVDEKHAVNE